MKAREIFEKDQVLTLKVAKSLVGKRIATTAPEYHMNTPRVEKFAVFGFISEWDDAAKREYPKSGKSVYENFQEYWSSHMGPKRIEELKNTILILDEEGNWKYRCHVLSHWHSEPTFTGSDADREVYYVIL